MPQMWPHDHRQMFIVICKILIVLAQEDAFDTDSCKFSINPKNVNSLTEGENVRLTINCSCHNAYSSSLKNKISLPKGVVIISIHTHNRHVARPSLLSYRSLHSENMVTCSMTPWCSTLRFDLFDQTYFYIHATQVGIAKMVIYILQPNKSHHSDTSKQTFSDILSNEFEVKVLRNYKLFHSIFDYSATFIASVTAFSVGCCTDILFLKTNIINPKAVLLSLACQHFLMPLIAIAISASLQLPSQLGYGLCAMSAIPGGGLAHLIVVLIQGDRALSTTISLFNTILGVLSLSLWLIFFSWFYQLSTRIEYIVIWIAPGVIAHATGFFLNKFYPAIAQGVLTWFSRPILLLSAILLITLGVYVNHYAFHYMDQQVVCGLCLIIFGGYCIGGTAGYIFKETTLTLKTIAAESSVFNCLLLIPALRGALYEPNGDLAATVPLWGIFFTPAPIILYFIVHKIKKWSIHFVERRKRKQSQHFSIVSSLAKMAEGMSAVSAPVQMNSSGHPLSVTDITTSL